MPAFLRPIFSRIIGALVGGFAAYLAGKGFTIDQQTIDASVTVLMTIFTIVYSLVHRAVDVKVNPKDIASPSKAAASKAEG